jgi:hypothetical protein
MAKKDINELRLQYETLNNEVSTSSKIDTGSQYRLTYFDTLYNIYERKYGIY